VTLATRIIALYHSSRRIIVWVVGFGTVLAGITCVSLLSSLRLLMTHYLPLQVVPGWPARHLYT
jgi:hypothetical protein